MTEIPQLSTLNDPINPDGEEDWALVHTRTYSVKSYITPDNKLVFRGAVADDKPGHLYVLEDPEGMRLHHMVVDLYVDRASMEILDVKVNFRAYPGAGCPAIAEKYRELIGSNLTRGFSKKVRDTFGGPNGCSHTTALLLAMAPVSVQTIFSGRYYDMREAKPEDVKTVASVGRQNLAKLNANTCHVWAEGGEVLSGAREGAPVSAPIPVQLRCKALGIDPDTWVKRVAE
jgi:Protein of unknown function (DUF2889)